MDDVLRVTVGHHTQQLPNHFCRISLIKLAHLDDPVNQLTSFYQLPHYENCHSSSYTSNTLMMLGEGLVHFFQHFQLLQHNFSVVLLHTVLLNSFHCPFFACVFVLTQAHLAKSA